LNSEGTVAYVTDDAIHIVRRISIISGMVTTIAGSGSFRNAFSDGPSTVASFDKPSGIASDAGGTFLLIADSDNYAIRRLVTSSRLVTTLAGSSASGFRDGIGSSASFSDPYGIAMDAAGTMAVVSEPNFNGVRLINVSTGQVSTIAGGNGIGRSDGVGTSSGFWGPVGIGLDPMATFAIVADTQNNLLRRIQLSLSPSASPSPSVRLCTRASGETTTFAMKTLVGNDASLPATRGFADGTGTAAMTSFPVGIAVSPNASIALFVDSQSNILRRVEISSGVVSTLAGSPNIADYSDGSSAAFESPRYVAMNAAGTFALVTDFGNRLVRRVDLVTGNVSTVAGRYQVPGLGMESGTDATFVGVYGVTMDSLGTVALVSDYTSNAIRRINVSTRRVSIVTGSIYGIGGYNDGIGT